MLPEIRKCSTTVKTGEGKT
ncbi:hypothetical protein ABFA07_012757 [Porites harrisoni]